MLQNTPNSKHIEARLLYNLDQDSPNIQCLFSNIIFMWMCASRLYLWLICSTSKLPSDNELDKNVWL